MSDSATEIAQIKALMKGASVEMTSGATLKVTGGTPPVPSSIL